MKKQKQRKKNTTLICQFQLAYLNLFLNHGRLHTNSIIRLSLYIRWVDCDYIIYFIITITIKWNCDRKSVGHGHWKQFDLFICETYSFHGEDLLHIMRMYFNAYHVQLHHLVMWCVFFFIVVIGDFMTAFIFTIK